MKFNINKSITLAISKEPITGHNEPYGQYVELYIKDGCINPIYIIKYFIRSGYGYA